MSTKQQIAPITTGNRSIQQLNANLASLSSAFDNTLSRDGTAPNQMQSVIDMNNNPIINIGVSSNKAAAVTLNQLQAATSGTNAALGNIKAISSFGTVDPTGVTSSDATFTVAFLSGQEFWIPAGTYQLTSSHTWIARVWFAQGASLGLATGTVQAIQVAFNAPVQQLFYGLGTISFSSNAGALGYPEWWGLVTNSSTFAASNITALNNAITALSTTILTNADYWVSNTIMMTQSNKRLIGLNAFYDGVTPNQVTRILCTDPSATILQVGASTFPGTINNMIQGLVVENLYLNRSVAPTISSTNTGCLVQYNISARIRNVKSVNSMNSFRFNGTVGCHIIDSSANRDTAGVGIGTDYWNGFWIDGSANIGAAGGNASLYITRPTAGCNISSLQATGSNGYYLSSNCQDTFLTEPETVTCYIGLNLNGGGTNANIQITSPKFDQNKLYGIYLQNISQGGVVTITDPYIAGATGSQFDLYINGCAGTVEVKGGQLLCAGVTGVQPVAIFNAVGVSLRGTVLKEAAGTGVGISGTCSNLVIETIHHNPTITSGAAIQLAGTSCNASKFAPTVYGKASAFAFGFQVVGAIDNRNEYNCTGIDSASIIGGSANKLVRNGTSVTTAYTLSGTNMPTGVMA